MNRFTSFAAVAWLSVVSFVLWVHACEPQEAAKAESCAPNPSKDVAPTDESWAQHETPVSALIPSIGPSRIGPHSEDIRHFFRNRRQAFSDLHDKLLIDVQIIGDNYFGWFSCDRRHEICRNLYVVEWPGNTLIEFKRPLYHDDVVSMDVEPISTKSRFLASKSALDALIPAGISDVNQNFERRQVTSDPSLTLLEASGDRATKSECKIVRMEMIGLTKRQTSCTHALQLITIFDKKDAGASGSSELDSFEKRAVAQFQSKFDEKVIISDDDENEIQFVGALRASETCLRCHSVGLGDLLGAMTYRLARVAKTTAQPRKLARTTPHPYARSIIVTRDDAYSEFHSKFESDFTAIKRAFGFRRMWRNEDRKPAKHSLHETSANWCVVEDSSGVMIVPREVTPDHFNEPFMDPVLNKSRLTFITLRDQVNSDDSNGYQCWLSSVWMLQCMGIYSFPYHAVPSTEWKLERLELIGLLKHPTPVVYKTMHVPKMDAIDAAPTAPLNSFESSAIDHLTSTWEKNVVVSETEEEIQIVGGLRASKNCMECHAVEPGQLLGALTYRLTRVTDANSFADSGRD